MEKDVVIHMVGQSCRPDQVEKLTNWYDQKHIPDIMEFKGVKQTSRCELAFPGQHHLAYQEQNYPQYLNIYEFDSQEAFEQYESRMQRPAGQPAGQPPANSDVQRMWGDDPVERLWRVQYKIVRTFVRD